MDNTNTAFRVGEHVKVLRAIHLPREVVQGEGRIVKITETASGVPLYWIEGFACARTADVLRDSFTNMSQRIAMEIL